MESRSLHLMHKRSESLTTETHLTASWAELLAKKLDLTASLFGKILTDEEINFWKETLCSYPAPHIEKAFVEHCREAQFFPRPAEILARLDALRERDSPEGRQAALKAEEAERCRLEAEEQLRQCRLEAEERRRQEQAEDRRRREAGETYGWADVLRVYREKLRGKAAS